MKTKHLNRLQTNPYIYAATEFSNSEEIVFTPAALLDFLCQIDELADYGISVEEVGNIIEIKIGDSIYTIDTGTAQEVEAPEEVINEVGDINDDTYDEVQNSDYTQVADETVEGGLVSEVIKTLAVGGLVRLTGKLLK